MIGLYRKGVERKMRSMRGWPLERLSSGPSAGREG